MNHFACTGDNPRSRGHDIPAAEYQVGDYVTGQAGSFKITGRPHREYFGAHFAACEVRWPAEQVDPKDIPALLTRAND
jgi:hypothetical protein